MLYRDNKYFSNGALFTEYFISEDKSYVYYICKGYYYNTELCYLSVSFKENDDGVYEPDIHIYFDNGGYIKSPLTKRALNRMRDLIYEIFDEDFGNTNINQVNHIFIEVVCNAVELFKQKWDITYGKSDKITVFGKEYDAEIYFN